MNNKTPNKIEAFRNLLTDDQQQQFDDLIENLIPNPMEMVNNDFISSFINSNPQPIIIADTDGYIVRKNEAFDQLFQMDLPADYNVFENCPESEKSTLKRYRSCLLNGETVQSDVAYQLPKGFSDSKPKAVYIKATTFPIKDRFGNISFFVQMHQDLTMEKSLSKELKDQSDKYLSIFNNIQDVYFETNAHGIITEISPSIEHYSGFNREELIGKNVISFYANATQRDELMRLLRKKGSVVDFEIQLKHKNGKIITAILMAAIKKNKEDGHIEIFGSMIDISDRKEMELKLKSSEEKFKLIFENSPHGKAIVDGNGHIIDHNENFKVMFGIPVNRNDVSELKEFPIFKDFGILRLVSSMLLIQQKKEIQIHIQAGLIHTEEQYYAIVCVPINLPGYKSTLAHLIVKDVTQEQKKDKAYKEMQVRFMDIFEKTNDLIYTLDLQGNFTSVNPIAEKWLGFKFNELKDKNMKNFITLDSYQRAIENIQAKLKGEKASSVYEITTFTVSGERKILEINSFLKEKDGKPVEIFGIARDVTVRKQHEEQIATALREKEFFIKEIHHRIKNNLQVILSLIRMNINDIEDEKAASMLLDLQLKIQAISYVHEDLYLSSNLHNIEFKPYVEKILANILDVFRSERKMKFTSSIENYKMNIDMAIPCGIILNELLTNSMKYAFNNNDEALINVGFSIHENEAELVISDNGKGYSQTLFEEPVDSLGLTLVKLLVEEQLNGSIKMLTESGTNYEIRFKLKT